MGLFTQDLKAFLEAQGYKNIYRDMMPDRPDECIGLFLYAHSLNIPNDGSGTRYVQVQVRRRDGDDANRVAHEICKILDSGMDEQKIQLTKERWCIARPRNLPKKMTADAKSTVFYYEVAMFGENTP